jgi:hypothetical protein
MTITRTITVAAGVFAPGHLGELTQVVPFELVDAVLAETGARERRLRVLPSRGPAWRGSSRAGQAASRSGWVGRRPEGRVCASAKATSGALRAEIVAAVGASSSSS